MITVKLMGGLGNQMFQYALGRHLAEINHTELVLDLSVYSNTPPGNTTREYELGVFNIVARTDDSSSDGRGFKVKFLAKQLSTRLTNGWVKKQEVIKEQGFRYQSTVLQAPDGAYLDGYWQSERYFIDIAEIIQHDFSLKTPLDAVNAATLATISQQPEAVSIHIRRGDYVANPQTNAFHGVMELGYYDKAIKYLGKQLKKPHFFVFSDDPVWCLENLHIDYPTTYVTHNSGNTGYKDMHLMSACKHHIIANSSFSWWGAWLNSSPKKLVVAPKQWFKDPTLDTRDLYLKGWHKL